MKAEKADAKSNSRSGDVVVEAAKDDASRLDEPANPSRPVNWSKPYKWSIVGLLSAMRLTMSVLSSSSVTFSPTDSRAVSLGTLICASAVPSIVADFGSNSSSCRNLLISIGELGEACGPLIVAPMSGLIGRMPVYNVCIIGFIAFSIGGALSTNIQSVMIFRCFQGLTVSSIVLDPSVIGDLFVVEQRGKAMAIGSLAALIAPIAGPVIGGYITETIGWRWTFWLPAIMGGASEIIFVILFRETYWPRILRKKTEELNGETADRADAANTFRKAIVLPVMMLCLSPVLLCVAAYIAVIFGFMYLILTSIEEAFQNAYGWSTGTASLSFISNGVGIAFGVFFCQIFLDKTMKPKARPGEVRIEGRIIPIVVVGITMPVGLILYGWTIESRVYWLVPMVGLALVGFGMSLMTIPASSYLLDVFGKFAASAIAVSIRLRCVTGAVIPLADSSLYRIFGQGWGNYVLGLISLVILPMPILLIRYGEHWRGSATSFESPGSTVRFYMRGICRYHSSVSNTY